MLAFMCLTPWYTCRWLPLGTSSVLRLVAGHGSVALISIAVWLGLVEEDDDRGYNDYDDSSYRPRSRYSGSRYAEDEFADEEDVEEERPVPRARTERSRPSDRLSSHADMDDHDRVERAGMIARSLGGWRGMALVERHVPSARAQPLAERRAGQARADDRRGPCLG